MAKRNVVVTGATGKQGRGFIHALLRSNSPQESPDYRIWAVTRDPSAPAATALLAAEKEYSEHLNLTKGDLNDAQAVRRIFAEAAADGGLYGSFIVLAYPGLGKKRRDEEQQGKMLADLALEFEAQIFVYSSTIPPTADQNDTLDLSHQAKRAVELYCGQLGQKGLKWVFARPGFFMENFGGFLGKLAVTILSQGLKKDTELSLVASEDIGRVVAAVFQDPKPFIHQVVAVTGSYETMTDVMAAHREVTGRDMPRVPLFLAKFFLSTSSGARKVVEQIEKHYEARVSGNLPALEVEVGRGLGLCELRNYRTWIEGKQKGQRVG